MAIFAPAAPGMRAWPRTEYGRPRVVVARVIKQLMGLGAWLTVGLLFSLVALPSYAEIKPGGLPNVSPARWARFVLIGLTLLLVFVKPFRAPLTELAGPETRRLWRTVAFFFVWYFCLNLYLNYSSGYFINEIKNNIFPSWLAFAFAAIYIRREQDYLLLLRALVVAMLVVVCVAPIEFVLKRNVFEGFISSEGWSQVGLVDQTRDGVYRVKVTFEHPLTCAQFLITVGAAFVAKGMFSQTGTQWRWVLLGLLSFSGVVLTYTRSGMLMASIVLGAILILKFLTWTSTFRNRLTAAVLRVQLLWLLFVAIGLGLWVYELVSGRTAEESMSSQARISMLTRGIPAILDSLIVGRGTGEGAKIAGFKGYFGVYFIDNIYLAYALDYGLLYCLVFVFILGFAIWRLCPSYDELRAPQANTGVRIGAALALAASACMLTMHATSALNEFIFGLIGATLCLRGRQFAKPRRWRRGP